MMRNMAGMMKKVQEMQTRMEALQQEMAIAEFTASVGGGAVTVTVTGKGEMRGVKIDPAAIDADDATAATTTASVLQTAALQNLAANQADHWDTIRVRLADQLYAVGN